MCNIEEQWLIDRSSVYTQEEGVGESQILSEEPDKNL